MQPEQPNPVQRATRAAYRVRRRVATGFALLLAVGFGYHAVFGHNGITAWAQKRNDDRVLSARIQKLENENARLQDHVEHLQNDPSAIEHEAREQLHYTRPDEIIYTLDERAKAVAPVPQQQGSGARAAQPHAVPVRR